MNIIVLAGGLSTERDVSFKSGEMIASALRQNGHNVILLDVFMGYSDKEENLDGIFQRGREVSVKVGDIPKEAPDILAVKKSRADKSDNFFGPNVIRMCQMADIVFIALHRIKNLLMKCSLVHMLIGYRVRKSARYRL